MPSFGPLFGPVFGVALAVLYGALALVAGYAWTHRADADAPTGLRTVGTVLVATWLALMSFVVLGGVDAWGRVGLGSVLLLATLLGVRGHGKAIREAWHADRAEILTVWPGWRSPLPWVAAVVTGGFAVRLLRGLLMPPLGIDALTYHVFRAGRFIQTGAHAIEPTPDAGGYYAYYPPLGDALWAVAMIPTHGDELFALVSGATMLGLVVTVAVAAVALGADRSAATWGALALAATPAVMSWSTATYVDGFVLVAVAAGVAWLPRAARSGRPGAIAMVIGAFAIAAGSKTTGIVPLGLGGLTMLWVIVRRTPPDERRAAVAVGLLAAVVVVPGLLHAALDHGNPLYPFPLQVGGAELLAGNEENVLLHRGALFPPEVTRFDLRSFFVELIWPNPRPRIQHLNFGPAGALLLLPAWAGIAWFVGPDRRVATGIVLLGVLAAFGLKLASTETLVLRTASAPAIGRFLTLPLLITVLAGTRAPRRLVVPVFAAAALGGTWLSFPRGLGAIDGEALVRLAPALAVAAVLGIVATRLHGRRRYLAAGLGAAVVLVTAIVLRPSLRSRYYDAAARGLVFDPHPIEPKAAAAWPIWAWLEDQNDPLRIAFASGWDGRGHHWYRSPLLGSRLQHEVVYVSPTKSGALIDYRLPDDLAAAVDPRAWVDRLVERRVDVVVLCIPQGPEHRWVVSLPAVFETVSHGVDDRCLAFRVHASTGQAGP